MTAKHNKGDKFIIEIAERHTHYTDKGKPYNVYRIKGFNTVMFDDYGLERFEKINPNPIYNIQQPSIPTMNTFVASPDEPYVMERAIFSNKILKGEKENYDY